MGTDLITFLAWVYGNCNQQVNISGRKPKWGFKVCALLQKEDSVNGDQNAMALTKCLATSKLKKGVPDRKFSIISLANQTYSFYI